MSPRELAAAALSRTPAPIQRVIRYGAIGIVVSVFYSVVIIALVMGPTRLNSTLASAIGFPVALPVGWLLHRTVSFGDRPYDRMQPLRFVISTTATFALAVGGMYVITEIGGREYWLGILWNWLTIPVMNFLFYLYWVFRDAH